MEKNNYLVDGAGMPYVENESLPAGGGLDSRCSYNDDAVHAFDSEDWGYYLEGRGFRLVRDDYPYMETWEKGNTRIVFESRINCLWGYVRTEFISADTPSVRVYRDDDLEAVAYQAEKKALVDSALASIRENGPYEAGNPAPVVNTYRFGEKVEEQILDVFIGEESGQVLVNSAPFCQEERHELTPLADYGNDEIRAILRATGIVRETFNLRSLALECRNLMRKGEGTFGPFNFADGHVSEEDMYLTVVSNETGKAVLVSWAFDGDFHRSTVIPESEFYDDEDGNPERVAEALEYFFFLHI